MRLLRATALIVAVGLPLSACNATGTTTPRAMIPTDASVEPEPVLPADEAPQPEMQARTALTAFAVGETTVEVSENRCGCGDPEERYLFDIARPGGLDEEVALLHSEALTALAHEHGAILADQTLWYLERRLDGAADPLVYFNFEPTYGETESLLVAYLSGDDRYATVLGGGWLRESNSDPRPEPAQWSHVFGTFQATRFEQ